MNGKIDNYHLDEAFTGLMGMVDLMGMPDVYCRVTPDNVWILVRYGTHFVTLLNNQISRTWLCTHDWLADPMLLDIHPQGRSARILKK